MPYEQAFIRDGRLFINPIKLELSSDCPEVIEYLFFVSAEFPEFVRFFEGEIEKRSDRRYRSR